MNLWLLATLGYLGVAALTFVPVASALLRRIRLHDGGDGPDESPLFSEGARTRLRQNHSRLLGTLQFWKKRSECYKRFHYYSLGWIIPSSVLMPVLTQAITQDQSAAPRRRVPPQGRLWQPSGMHPAHTGHQSRPLLDTRAPPFRERSSWPSHGTAPRAACKSHTAAAGPPPTRAPGRRRSPFLGRVERTAQFSQAVGLYKRVFCAEECIGTYVHPV